MGKIAILVLSGLLAIAVVSGSVFYSRYNDTREELEVREKTVSDLNARVVQLNQEASTLQEEISKSTKRLSDLEIVKEHTSQLENKMKEKDREFSELWEEFKKVQGDYNEARKTGEGLKAEVSSREARLKEVEEQLKVAQSRITTLDGELGEGRTQMEGLRGQIAGLRDQKVMAETELAKQKAGTETTISRLRSQIDQKEKLVAELEEQLKVAQSRITALDGELGEGRRQMEGLRGQIAGLRDQKVMAETELARFKSTCEALLAEFIKPTESKDISVKFSKENISVSFIDRIMFEFGKASINPEGEKILKKVGHILQNVQGKKIRVIGHTDTIPISKGYQNKYPSNWELSAARATAVVRYFQQNSGLDPREMEAIGRSFYDPIASNATKEGRSKNRRVEIIIASETGIE